MRPLRAIITLALIILAVGASSALGAGDDYPAAYRNGDPATQADRWGYAVRTQPSFVAWRLEQAGITGSANQGWGLMVQSASSVEELRDLLAPMLGARVDTTPEAGAIALWPSPGAFSFTSWVSAVNGDGTVATENYSTNNGYYEIPTTQAPWYVHLPPRGGITVAPVPQTPGPVLPPAPPPVVTPVRFVPSMSVFAFSGHRLQLRTKLERARLVSVQITGPGPTVTIRRVIAAGRRITTLRVRPRLAQGRYVVTLRNGDRAAPAITLRSRARKTA